MRGLSPVPFLAALAVALLLGACGGDEPAGLLPAPPRFDPVMAAAVGVDPVTGAFVMTDRDDYLPGDTVRITGSGWQAGETVRLHLTEDPPNHPEHDYAVAADGAGSFAFDGLVLDSLHLGVTFTLTATGESSGSVATTMFTDGNPQNISVEVTQSPNPVIAGGSATFTIRVNFGGNASLCTVALSAAPTGSPAWPAGHSITFSPANVTGRGSQAGISAIHPLSTVTVGTPAAMATGTYQFVVSGTNAEQAGEQCQGTGPESVTIPLVVMGANHPPTAFAGEPYTADEGLAGVVLASATASDPDAGDVLSFQWTTDQTTQCAFDNATLLKPTFSCTDDAVATVTLTVTDPDNATAVSFTTVTVNNVAPSIDDIGGDEAINPGDTFTRNGTFTDPGADDWSTSTVDYGAGGGAEPLSLSGKTYSLSHMYASSGNYTVEVCVRDDDGGEDCESFIVTVANTPPTVDAGADASLDEGDTFNSSGSFTDPDADTWSGTVDYGDGSGVQSLTLNADKTFTLSHLYADDGMFTVTVCIDDGAGPVCDTGTVTVANVAPEVDAGADASVDEGSAFSRSVSFTDPGADSWSATVDWDDGNGPQSLGTVTSPFSIDHTYTDDGSFNVQVCVLDDDGGQDCDDVQVTVNNVAPVVDAGADASVDEGSAFSRSVSFTDPGADSWSSTVDWDDGNGPRSLGTVSSPFSIDHTYPDDGSFTVRVCVQDDDLGEGCDEVQVTVDNVAPVITDLTPVDGAIFAITDPILFTATFTDPGVLDEHICTTSATSATVVTPVHGTQGNGSGGECTSALTVPEAGVYNVVYTLDDQDGGTDTRTVMIVVYDPSAGFVTGGGWIDSPVGAAPAFPDATGKANFGFVSKYQKGAKKPDGETQFQFKAGNINFHSTSYEWLVVAGARAQYKGVGRLNGVDGYGFILTAIDGQISGGGGTDRFRIKITDPNGVVYDNQMGASDDADPGTTLGGGSIVIHTGGNGKK